MMDKTYVDETLRGHCETTANTSHGAHIPWTQHHTPNVRGQNIHGQNNNAPKYQQLRGHQCHPGWYMHCEKYFCITGYYV